MLNNVAIAFLVLGVCTSLMIVKDLLRRPATVGVMNLVWPVTGLYMPFVGWLAWWYFGRQQQRRTFQSAFRPVLRQPTAPGIFTSTSLCASGCVIGAILAVALQPLFAHLLPGSPRLSHALLSMVLALTGGLLVQILGWREAGHCSWSRALFNTLKNDLFPLFAWQLGVFLCLELAIHFVLHNAINPRLASCWFMLQTALCIGFIFAWPANKRLLSKGLKQGL